MPPPGAAARGHRPGPPGPPPGAAAGFGMKLSKTKLTEEVKRKMVVKRGLAVAAPLTDKETYNYNRLSKIWFVHSLTQCMCPSLEFPIAPNEFQMVPEGGPALVLPWLVLPDKYLSGLQLLCT